MKIRNVVMSAAVATLLAASGIADAQLLGGGATGGLGGSITGGLGNLGGTAGGTLNGSLHGSTDALGRTREIGSRAADVAGDAGSNLAVSGEELSGDAAGDVAGQASGELGPVPEPAEAAPIVSEEKPAKKPRRAARGSRANGEPAEPEMREKPAAKPAPQARAGGEAKADGGLAADRDGQATATAGASVNADASIEK